MARLCGLLHEPIVKTGPDRHIRQPVAGPDVQIIAAVRGEIAGWRMADEEHAVIDPACLEAGDVIVERALGGCKRGRENPSLKRPGSPVAPE